MSRQTFSRVVLFLVVTVLCAGQMFGQGFQGTVRGEVRDASGSVVPGATVKLKNDATGESRTQQTTSAGTFSFPELLVGAYTVAVEAAGFSTYTRPGVEVKANQVVEVLATLQVGDVKVVVEVGAGAELVQTSTAQLAGGTYVREAIELPMGGLEGGRSTGSPLNLAVLAPGTTSMPGGMAGVGGSIGGHRPRQNNFVIDGLDNNLPSVTGPLASIIQDSVQEFTLLTNQFTAEFGHSAAGQFITVTKSGTNKLHGGGWWNLQNRDLNSLDNITRSITRPGADKPRYDWNRFGGQLGGRILRDRWFYYGAYEYRNLTLAGAPSGQILVPTSNGLAALRGLASNPASGISPINVGILADQVPAASAGTRTVNVTNEALAAPNNLVPIEIGTFSAVTPNFSREHIYLVNSDFLTGRHRFSGRYSGQDQSTIAAGALPVPAFNSNSPQIVRRATFSDVFTITPRLVNEFRAAYNRFTANNPVDLPAGPGGNDVFANYSITDLSLAIGPLSNFPQGQANNIYQLVDTLSWSAGRHTIKVGGDVRNIIATSTFLPRQRGEYIWNSLDLFVRDTFPTALAARGAGLANFAQNRTATFGFLQDNWKIHPRVTLDLGVRYEFTTIARDSNLQDLNSIASIPDFRANPVFSTLPAGHQETLLRHLGPSLIFRTPRPDRNNWAPRIGLAWDVFGDGKTSFRAGFGIAHDVLFGNLALLGLPPQVQTELRELNVCTTPGPPRWCAQVPAGGNPQNVPAISFRNIGFIEGGQYPALLPPGALTNPAVARGFTQAYFFDDEVPETYTWSASLQRQIGQSWLAELRYVGNHAINLPIQRWANAGVPLPANLPTFFSESEARAASFAGRPTQANLLAAQNLLLIPFGFNGVTTMFTPDGQSWYHGGSAILTKRFSRGLQFSTNYTWSKTIDLIENELNTSQMNPRRPLDMINIFANKGLSGLHRAHKFVVHWLWNAPGYKGGNGFLKRALGGWQWNASWVAESGQPVTITSRRDLNGDVDTAGDTAILNPNGQGNTSTDSSFVCFRGGVTSISTTAAGCGGSANIVGYVAQNPNARYVRGQFGAGSQIGRGTIISPGMNVWNMSIVKNTPVWGEGRNLQFRVTLFNTFNHPNFIVGQGSAFPTTVAAQTQFGYVVPGAPQFLDKTIFSGGLGNAPFQRLIEFGLKLNF